ncbi:MAG: CBS domain-containing protein [Caldisericales bacterium]|nr:CBS domain-containing protein [Caldisericales bacterium]
MNHLHHEKISYWLDALLAFALGGLACLAVYGFQLTLSLGSYFNPEKMSAIWVIAIPSLSGLVVGATSYFLRISGAGAVVDTIAGANLKRRILAKPSSLLKPVLAAISIVGGNPVGSGTVIMLGGTVAAFVGQYLNIPHRRRRLLIGCGAAAGIASVFLSPLAGIAFVIEVVLMEYSPYSFSMLALSSGSAFLFSKIIGIKPLFPIPSFLTPRTIHLIVFALIGISCAIVSFMWARFMSYLERNRNKVKYWQIFGPLIGGLVTGTIAIFIPEIWGPGFGAIGEALQTVKPVLISLCIVGVKIVGSSVVLGLGGAGGDLAPAIFIGAFIGAAFAPIAPAYLPVFVFAGICAQLASAFHAPLTSVLLALEMTGQMALIVPVVMATSVASLLSIKLSPRSIYQEGLHKRGIQSKLGQFQNPSETKIVDVMSSYLITIDQQEPVKKAIDLMRNSHVSGLPVLDGKNLFGVITLSDLRNNVTTADLEKPVGSFCSTDLVTITPDAVLSDCVAEMSENEIGRLLVVSPSNSKKLLGIVSKKDLLELATRRYAKIGD